MPAVWPPTWADVERLGEQWGFVHQAVVMRRRGDWTEEEALCAILFALAIRWQPLFRAEVERRALTYDPPVILTNVR